MEIENGASATKEVFWVQRVMLYHRVCQHPSRTATQPDSFEFLISATQSEASVWIRIPSAFIHVIGHEVQAD